MSASASGARGGALLPSAQAPVIVCTREAKPAELDALLAHVNTDVTGFGVRFTLERAA